MSRIDDLETMVDLVEEEMDEKDYDKEDNGYLDEIDSQDMYEEEYETPPEEYEELKSYELDKLYDELEDEYEQ